jgi:hypothetical protein
MVRYEQLQRHEGPRLRAIRLRALEDAPNAFGTTFDEARLKTLEHWEKQLLELPTFAPPRQHVREHQRELALD